MAVFNRQRKFGVEIETHTRRAASTIQNEINRQFRLAGVTNRCEAQGYNHNDQPIWKIVPDATIQGWEIVSPPMQGYEGQMQLKAVCKALDVLGVTVDQRCGLHVHHDAADLTGEQLGKIGAIYSAFQFTIDRLVAPSRRGNRWAQRLNWDSITQRGAEKFKGDTKAGFLAKLGTNFTSTRYLTVNFQALLNHGTVEFRQHQGSVNATKIWNWVLFTQAIVEAGAKAKTQTKPATRLDSQRDGFAQLRRVCQIKASKNNCSQEEAQVYLDCFNFWAERYRHFSDRDPIRN